MDDFYVLQGRSLASFALARPWFDPEFGRIVREDAIAGRRSFAEFRIVMATDHEDLELATDYHVELRTRTTGAFGFRGRDVARCRVGGRAVRQMTLRKSGARGHREYDKVLGLDEHGHRSRPGHGDFYVTVWADDNALESGVIVDLDHLRRLPPDRLMRLEVSGKSNVPFVGYDVAALAAHGVVRAAFPDTAFFERFLPTPGGLW